VNFVAFYVLSGLVELKVSGIPLQKQDAVTLRILTACNGKKLRNERKFSQLQQVTLSAYVPT
jgi:hypothetical protein